MSSFLHGARRSLPAVALAALVWGCATGAGPAPEGTGSPESAPVVESAASAAESVTVPAAEESVAATTPEPDPEAKAKELFEVHCSGCHALDLAVAQRLDRANWEWVMEDMVETNGLTWLTPEEQEVIIDYLTENYGRPPARPR